jgi:hypothetical protein
LSGPKLVSDLLFIGELLKPTEKESRNDYLKEMIRELNKGLPSDVYLPISSLDFNPVEYKDVTMKKKGKRRKHRPHRILSISTDYAFCLHSKERVPYHIFIEVEHFDKVELLSEPEQQH